MVITDGIRTVDLHILKNTSETGESKEITETLIVENPITPEARAAKPLPAISTKVFYETEINAYVVENVTEFIKTIRSVSFALVHEKKGCEIRIIIEEIVNRNYFDPEKLAASIRRTDIWDSTKLYYLCRLAGLEKEFVSAKNFFIKQAEIARKAAQILGVKIE